MAVGHGISSAESDKLASPRWDSAGGGHSDRVVIPSGAPSGAESRNRDQTQ